MSVTERALSAARPITDAEARPPFIGIALLSAAALAHEVLLTRLFSITLWHHFAYLIISAALLGYGASGSFLALARERLERRFATAFVTCACAFGVTAAASFALAQRIPFNPLELFWDPRQTGYLLGIYMALIVPFFFAATGIGLALSRFGRSIGRVYSADILGAGAGSAAVIAALFVVRPIGMLELLPAIGLAAATIALVEMRMKLRVVVAPLAVTAIVAVALLAGDWIRLAPSPYKDLSQALQTTGARVVAERDSPLAQVTLVESPRVPFRHAPGMSLAAPMEPTPQLGVFSDGNGLIPLTRFDGDLAPLEYLDYLTSALPYHLKPRPRVLVLGAGAGADVLQALYHRAASVDAVELDRRVVGLVRGEFAQYAGGLYDRPDVALHLAEARSFVAAPGPRYDIIQVALLDSFGGAAAGLYSLSENYLYTVEAFADYLARLEPGGVLAVTRWITLPPRDTLKLFATAVAALERAGIAQPGKRLVLIRGWKTSTLLMKNGDFSTDEIAAVREFCRVRSFDVAHHDGIAAGDVNRYNKLEAPSFYTGAQALLSPERDAFVAGYKFNIAPPTDDRPFFFRFLKWESLPEIIALREQGGLPLLEWGYPVLVATLVQAVLASALFILLPLRKLRPAGGDAGESASVARWRVAAFFAAIGFGFIFLELAFIQKFILFLGHPLYAIAVVLCAFLVFAGLGSRFSERVAGVLEKLPGSPLGWIGGAIGVLAFVYVLLLPPLLRELIGVAHQLGDAGRIAVAVVLIAPLGTLLGMPFPIGLSCVANQSPAMVPWAWAVNGSASVTGAVIATLLAMHAGFIVVVAVAAVGYWMAGGVAPKTESRTTW